MKSVELLQKCLEFIYTIKTRTVDSKNTTIGGGVAGVVFAAVIGKLEEISGCHFTTAFANIDYMQLTGFIFMQVYGALTTDADKTISVAKAE